MAPGDLQEKALEEERSAFHARLLGVSTEAHGNTKNDS